MTGDVSLLNANFETVSEPIDGYNSFFVDDYYYATGTFELHLPVRYFHAAKNDAEYIFVSGNNICAKIDEVTYKNDNSGLDLVIKGSMLEAILRDRIIDSIYEYNDTVENVVYAVLGQFALTGDRRLSIPMTGVSLTLKKTITAREFHRILQNNERTKNVIQKRGREQGS